MRGVEKRSVARGGEISFSKVGGKINIIFGLKYKPCKNGICDSTTRTQWSVLVVKYLWLLGGGRCLRGGRDDAAAEELCL